jgi:hypothetical protein
VHVIPLTLVGAVQSPQSASPGGQHPLDDEGQVMQAGPPVPLTTEPLLA